MGKRILRIGLIFFFLFTLLNAEAGWIRANYWHANLSFDDSIPLDTCQDDGDYPADTEEDTTGSREIDEYDSDINLHVYATSDRLLNLHYIYHHLLFKEHFADAVVPPPKA